MAGALFADVTPGERERLTREDFRWLVEHALVERARGRGALPDLLGLDGAELAALAARWLRGAELPDLERPPAPPTSDQEAIALLLLWRGGSATQESRWLARIIARRAMEPRHLWEDLGLPSRPALREMIARHFPRIAAANDRNMRWKKFFYRQICSDADFALCLSPSCDECPERAACFAPE